MPELWQPIEGYEGFYEVSDHGRVRRLPKDKLLKPWYNTRGYRQVSLCKNGVVKRQRVCRLVAIAFVSGDSRLVVNHKDSNRANDVATNLEWVTQGENVTHAYRGGRLSRFSRAEWLKILERIAAGEQQQAVAKSLGMSKSSFCQMKARYMKFLS